DRLVPCRADALLCRLGPEPRCLGSQPAGLAVGRACADDRQRGGDPERDGGRRPDHCCLQARTESRAWRTSSATSDRETKCAPTATSPRASVAADAPTWPVRQAGSSATAQPTRTTITPRIDWSTRFMVSP